MGPNWCVHPTNCYCKVDYIVIKFCVIDYIVLTLFGLFSFIANFVVYFKKQLRNELKKNWKGATQGSSPRSSGSEVTCQTAKHNSQRNERFWNTIRPERYKWAADFINEFNVFFETIHNNNKDVQFSTISCYLQMTMLLNRKRSRFRVQKMFSQTFWRWVYSVHADLCVCVVQKRYMTRHWLIHIEPVILNVHLLGFEFGQPTGTVNSVHRNNC